jgi:hypothetical protein
MGCLRLLPLVFLCLSQESLGRVSGTVLMGAEEAFTHTRYSPLMGMEALDRGILERIRWDLVTEEGGLDPEGRRKCGDDKGIPDDPHFKLIKELFPSGACEFQSKDFGFDPETLWETMARLMVYTAQVRAYVGKPTGLDKLKEDTLLKKNNIQALLGLLDKAILKEKREWGDKRTAKGGKGKEEGSSSSEKGQPRTEPFYPKYFVELILSAYVCDRANTKEDIEAYIRALQAFDSNHLITKKTPEEVHLQALSPEAFDHVKEIKDPYAKKFFAQYIKNIHSHLPYQDGVTLSQNGSTHPVSGPEGEIDFQGDTFQNCAEEALKHLFNILLFDPVTRTFDLSHLGAPNPGHNRIGQLQDFYKLQGVDDVNNTDLELKDAWNRVMGDLNSLNSPRPPVKYKRDSENEILSGWINQIHVLERVLDQEFLEGKKEEDLTEKGVKDAWTKAVFFILSHAQKHQRKEASQIFQITGTLNKITRQDRHGAGYPEWAGNLQVTLPKQYEFTFRAVNSHSYTFDQRQLAVVKNDLLAMVKKDLLAKEKTEQNNFAEDLFFDGTEGFLVSIPAYLVFRNSSRDSASIRETFMDFFTPLYEPQKKFLEVFVVNVLPRYAWQDQYSRDKLFEILEPILAKKEPVPGKQDFFMKFIQRSERTVQDHVVHFLIKNDFPRKDNLWKKQYLDFLVKEHIFYIVKFFDDNDSSKRMSAYSNERPLKEGVQEKYSLYGWKDLYDELLASSEGTTIQQDLTSVFSYPGSETWQQEFNKILQNEYFDDLWAISIGEMFLQPMSKEKRDGWGKEFDRIISLSKKWRQEQIIQFRYCSDMDEELRTDLHERLKNATDWGPYIAIFSCGKQYHYYNDEEEEKKNFWRTEFPLFLNKGEDLLIKLAKELENPKFFLYRWPEELDRLRSEGMKFPLVKEILEKGSIKRNLQRFDRSRIKTP